MFNDIINFFVTNKYDILIILSTILFVTFLYFKNKSLLKKIIEESVRQVEKQCNSPLGQARIDEVVAFLNKKVDSLPKIPKFIAKHFTTKYWVVTTIEKTLNFVQSELDLEGPEIDILGNEIYTQTTVATKCENKNNNVKVGIDLERKTIVEKPHATKDYDGEIYASLKAETDLHSNPNVKAEVGVKKRF